MAALSKRKSGKRKAERKTIQIDAVTHAIIDKYAKSRGLNMNFIVHECVTFGTQYDLSNTDWSKRAKLDPDEAQIIASMKPCDGRAVGKNESGKTVISCVWFRDGKPPQIRKLGRIELAEDRCVACSRTEMDEIRFEAQGKRITELERGLTSRARELYKIPVCEGGAHLSPDGTSFERCKRSNISVDVLRFCKVVDDGPCAYFREIVVGVGEKK